VYVLVKFYAKYVRIGFTLKAIFESNFSFLRGLARFRHAGGIIQRGACLPVCANGCSSQLREQPVIQKESPLAGRSQVNRPIKMLSATLVLGAGLSAAGTAYAAPEAKLNHCWGQVTKEFQAVGEPGMGDHASSHSPFTPDPGEGGRRGVGNVSKEDHGDLSDGGQGMHAIAVAPSSDEFQASLPEECRESDMP
jgi:hypothetical protein